MVRDEQGSWIPGAHMLTAREDSDIVAAGLQTVSPLSLQCSLLTIYIHRLSGGAIIDGTSAICLQMTLPVSSLQSGRPSKVSLLGSRRLVTFSARCTPSEPYEKPSLGRPIGGVEST